MKHTFFVCKCYKMGCVFCDGGLSSCTVCKGSEGSLPTECPGKPMDWNLEQAVYNGLCDFIDGSWVEGKITKNCKASLLEKLHESNPQI